MLKVSSSQWFSLVLIPVAFLFVLFYSQTTSPLYVLEGQDSCIFKTMGLAILQGKTPYVDFFDHKGPILYFINALGEWLIPGRLGIFILQVIGLSITLFFLDKTARLFLRSDVSFLVVLFSLFILAGLYQEGNQCEEWELPAIAIGIYLATSFFSYLNYHSLRFYSIIWGLCFGYVFFIRPNDAVSQFGGIMLGVLAYLVSVKEHRKVVLSVFCFVSSFICVSLPILLFFASRNALPDLYYGLIQHNAQYSEGIFNMFLSSFDHEKWCFFILFVPMGYLMYHSGYKTFPFILIPLLALSLLLTGSRIYLHYFIVYLPLFVFWGIVFFRQKDRTVLIVLLVLLYSCSCGSIRFLKRPIGQTRALIKTIIVGNEEHIALYKEAGELVHFIPEEEREDIWNYNLMWNRKDCFSFLFHYGIVQCNRVPLYTMYLIDKKLKETDRIDKKNPKWVFISHEEDVDLINEFSTDYDYIFSHYSLVGAMNPDNCTIELYRRNE